MLKTSAANHMFLTNFVQAVIEAAPRRVHRFLYFCEADALLCFRSCPVANPTYAREILLLYHSFGLGTGLQTGCLRCHSLPFPSSGGVGRLPFVPQKKSTLMHTPGLSVMKNNLCASTHVCTDTSALKILKKRYLQAGMFRLFK